MTSSLPSEPTPDKDAVSPWQETVRLSPVPPGPRPNSEPSIPDEVVSAPLTARFGKFVRTRRLGAGGMGEVWKAWDTVLGRWVALKFLKGGDDDEIARFQREAQTAGRLHHPNIAAIYEVNEDQGRRYIAMQFVDGQNFHDFPRQDRRLLVSLIVDAARGLQYAHDQGVIHRDLKPENLMVTTRGDERQVFLMDFGLARAAEGASKLSATGFLLGTPMYMSPEQARGEKVEVSTDVYSLGLTLYELLTDANPFASENVYETLRRVQELDPTAPREIDRRIDEDLETIVLKAISKDPGSRYASAKGFGDDLQAYLAGEPIQGRRESLSRQVIRRVRRHPWAFAAGAVLVVGLATSGLIARSALRDRRYTDLTEKLDEGLRAREWTPEHLRSLELMIDDLARLAPARATELRTRLPKALAESIRASDLVRARAQLALLERIDPAEASRVGSELRQRETQWPPVFKLEPPFGELRDVFERGRVDVAEDRLRSGSAGLVRTLKTCEGNVELKAEFEGPWKEAAQLGLLFNPGDPSGYQFLLTTPEGAPPPSFATVRAGKGSFRLQIRRGEAMLREESIPAALIDTEGALRLMARREDDLLKVQANDLPLVEFQDPFSVRSGPKGVFAVEWPAGVGIRRLLATRQSLPVKPSPLDVGDSLFLQKRYDEAIDRYGEAAQSLNTGSSRIEALYKQGLCNLQLSREDQARKIFEGVAAGFITAPQSADKRWYFLADCQLLVLHFRDPDGIERATGILDKLKEYQYSFDRLALLMPPDVRRQVLHSVQIGSVGGNFHRRPEDHVARIEFALRASELLESPAQRGEWSYQGLMRAYMMVGRNLDAIRIAERSFRVFRFGGEALDDYCWIRRLSGDEKEIRQALAALDRAVP
ncbi:MAG TPA: protein kinase, partial [Planctomycetota bacterium]|nr:protein kinase [Planctomycetota bacterium]